eukprot:TRINITY_DN1036_c0_g1_i2.p1 TRINITY_DN1036_c0_g1~~TRINITY_DN1036_c0_g1_i2.p1  ORF type:complete len:560 (-),score=83.89 TRINITY_DN1036_c0_g1_i2:1091-2770(-)
MGMEELYETLEIGNLLQEYCLNSIFSRFKTLYIDEHKDNYPELEQCEQDYFSVSSNTHLGVNNLLYMKLSAFDFRILYEPFYEDTYTLSSTEEEPPRTLHRNYYKKLSPKIRFQESDSSSTEIIRTFRYAQAQKLARMMGSDESIEILLIILSDIAEHYIESINSGNYELQRYLIDEYPALVYVLPIKSTRAYIQNITDLAALSEFFMDIRLCLPNEAIFINLCHDILTMNGYGLLKSLTKKNLNVQGTMEFKYVPILYKILNTNLIRMNENYLYQLLCYLQRSALEYFFTISTLNSMEDTEMLFFLSEYEVYKSIVNGLLVKKTRRKILPKLIYLLENNPRVGISIIQNVRIGKLSQAIIGHYFLSNARNHMEFFLEFEWVVHIQHCLHPSYYENEFQKGIYYESMANIVSPLHFLIFQNEVELVYLYMKEHSLNLGSHPSTIRAYLPKKKIEMKLLNNYFDLENARYKILVMNPLCYASFLGYYEMAIMLIQEYPRLMDHKARSPFSRKDKWNFTHFCVIGKLNSIIERYPEYGDQVTWIINKKKRVKKIPLGMIDI